jgi:acetamidase/formamidase
MKVHHFKPDHYWNEFGKQEPVLRLKPGDSVVTSTLDAHGVDANLREVGVSGNPLTGPFYVEGAEEGDTLVVHIERVNPNRASAWSRIFVSEIVVDKELAKSLPGKQYARWRIDTENKTVTLLEPGIDKASFVLPLSPMMGCIGVAPPGNTSIKSITSGRGGGNLDYFIVRAGTTMMFPVFTDGGLLYLGDVHAAQGQGEPSGSGVEVSADVQFSVDVMKGKQLRWPQGEDKEFLFTIGSDTSLIKALQFATTEMMHLLEERYGLDLKGASLLLGQCAFYDIASVTNPSCTVACRVSKQLLGSIQR